MYHRRRFSGGSDIISVVCIEKYVNEYIKKQIYDK